MKQIIAVVFDFDETLALDTTSGFLNYLGIDVNDFWKNKVQKLLDQGWDPIPAYLYKMLDESNNGYNITKESFLKWAPKVEFFKGVTRLFHTLRQQVVIHPDISIEFYVISSGIGEILKATKISKHFKEIWASDFAYDKSGKIIFPKRIVSFTDKTRYLFHISKGLVGNEYQNRPFEVNRKIDRDKLRIPFTQMIFVGDGSTDIPCFALLKSMGGVSLAVYDQKKDSKWGTTWGFAKQDRVVNIAPADYSKDSAILNSLKMAINSIIDNINLSKKSYQG